ncbi:MAG: C39 family peptidase [Myxococcota bacterium]
MLGLIGRLGTALFAMGPYPSVHLADVPFVRQKPDFCGEADVEMALRRLGREVNQDQVFRLSKVDLSLGRGAVTDELAGALRRLGFDPGPVWHRVDPRRADAQIEAEWAATHQDLLRGQPSIVCMHFDSSPDTTEHFRLVTGYDAARDEVIFQDPALDDGAAHRLARAEFLRLWTFKPRPDRWTLIRLRLTPDGPAPAIEPEPAPTSAEIAQHVLQLKETLPAGFTVAVERPFVVIGNEEPKVVRERAKKVVGWFQRLLQQDFALTPPGYVVETWLFKDAASYERYSRQRFKTEPDTPYGYYLPDRRAMVMNIRPGYGTLTHEMVHPFFEAAWPGGPAWLNEGLGSLFERPAERRGHLVGKVNWRLPAIQEAIQARQAPRLYDLTHTTSAGFYRDEGGVSYAAARYLCYWLQEKGLLQQFLEKALAQRRQDPSGWTALTELVGDDPDAPWQTFVAGLKRE